MSLEAITWAYAQTETKGVEKFVLVTMADYCDQNGLCFPTAAHVGRKTGISVDAVRRHVRKLEAKGLLRREAGSRDNGSQTSNRFELPITGGYDVLHPSAPAPTPEPSLTSELEDVERVQGSASTPPYAELHTPPNGQLDVDAPTEFETWLAHYRAVTGRGQIRGSKSAKASFDARRREGFDLEDLKLATVGAHGDEWMRANSRDVPETILRGSNITRYIELARRNGHTTAPVDRRVEQGVPQVSRDGGETWETDWDRVT